MVLEIWNNGKIAKRIRFKRPKRVDADSDVTETTIPLSPKTWPEGELKTVTVTHYPNLNEIVLSIQTA